MAQNVNSFMSAVDNYCSMNRPVSVTVGGVVREQYATNIPWGW